MPTTRRNMLSLMAGAGALAAGRSQAAPPPRRDRPNVLFVLVDNLGYGDLGCYGGGATRGAPTPRIDRLASEGLRLTNMNMEAQCTPSRSAILTGRYHPLGHPQRAVRRRRRWPHPVGGHHG